MRTRAPRSLLVLVLLATACEQHPRVGARAVGPPTERALIRTDRPQYGLVQPIFVTTRNVGTDSLFEDHCAGAVEGYNEQGKWSGSYGMLRECYWPDPERWREYSVAIAPGGVHRDTFHVNGFAYDGSWRVQLVLRDVTGRVLPLEQRISNTFQVRASSTP